MATFEAKVFPSWIRGMILRSLLFFAFAALFVYDGAVAWPKRTKVAQEYLKFIDEGHSKHDWQEHAAKLGLGRVKDVYTHEHVKDQRQLNEQFYWAAGLCLIGFGFLGKILLDKNKVLSFDDEAIISPEGKRVPFTTIREISTEKWEKKGLGYVRYQTAGTEDGKLAKITLDDLKFDGAEKVLERAQAHLGLPLESEVRAAAKAEAERQQQLQQEQTAEDLLPPPKEG